MHTLFSENIDVKKLFEEVYNMLKDDFDIMWWRMGRKNGYSK